MTTHKVRSGETLSSIAKRFSVEVSALKEQNHVVNERRLAIGQVLVIPEKRQRNAPPAAAPTTPARTEPARKKEDDLGAIADDAWLQAKKIWHDWSEDMLRQLRTTEANEHVQATDDAKVTPQQKPVKSPNEPAQKPGSRSPRKLSDIKDKLKEELGKEPHVVVFNGVKLTDNEKKQIIASVALCEMNADGFGSMNTDQEFVGRKYGARGVGGLTYSRIVHIGLSYGIIQYTQDSGSLGELLAKMRAKNTAKFDEVLGGGDADVASSLVTLTTSGRPDLANNAAIPLSGLSYWQKIRKTAEGKELTTLANGPKQSDLPTSREIRGKRVQPIAAKRGAPATDLWQGDWRQRFLDAGKIVDFQEVQIELAVKNFMNPFLPLAKQRKVRSALALAFIAACNIRGGVGSKLSSLFYDVATELKVTMPFNSSEDERKCIDAIANAKGSVGDVKINDDETRRAKLLIKDELGFLAEDLYDCSTYA